MGARAASIAPIRAAFPAVTCTAQSDYLTGALSGRHGIVGNGWYLRDDCEVRFWRQSNRLVQAPKIWDTARAEDPSFTCANLFWWFNMYSSVGLHRDAAADVSGRRPQAARRLHAPRRRCATSCSASSGTFPLFNFWGPRASIASTRWIAEAAKRVERKYRPTLTLVYLPHLDYNLQRVGPSRPGGADRPRQVDGSARDLIRVLRSARRARSSCSRSTGLRDVSRPVHLNRVLREHGLLAVREELGLELLDAGASAAFAVADHQVAHVYVNDPVRMARRARASLESAPGVERVLDADGKRELPHRPSRAPAISSRSPSPTRGSPTTTGSTIARAPDFARTVDIHRKPGYDPVELFLDPGDSACRR